IEAQTYGVRVSAICPAAVETPLLDAAVPGDLTAVAWQPNVRRFLENAAGPAYPAERLADAVLQGVERNQGLIIVPQRARLIAWLNRWFPSLVAVVLAKAARDERHKTRH
ncbi:MAG: short-chain dehydrogenase, partial [Betaproteobacteria bacterium]|nr:short-chain dehydrogenase [Betaproteobacteria bacterium]